MKLKCLLPSLLLLYCAGASAQSHRYDQQQNFLKANSYWSIRNVDVDFNKNPPLATLNDSSDVFEGTASAADPVSGVLNFYSNGYRCWDRNHNVMPNGDSLYGNGGGRHSGGSTTQGVCIVPMIDSPGKYYLFSLCGLTDMSPSNISTGSLYYSVVDMSLRGGLGDIVAGRKNILLDNDTLAESMIAIPGNNCDIWLMVHQAGRAEFKAYHITNAGVQTTPVVSATGSMIWYYPLGGMTVSPNRERIILTSFSPFCQFGYADSTSGVLLCKFNPATGVVSDAIQIEKDLQTYSVVFSPDNNKVYMGNYDHLKDITSLQQYDVSKYDTASINASRQLIASIGSMMQGGSGFGTLMPYLKLYRDTIYFPNVVDGTFDATLSSINKPNLSGTACEYKNATVALPKGINPSICLPTEVVYPVPGDSTYALFLDTVVCEKDWATGIQLKPAEILDKYEYSWNNGASGSTTTITAAGKYWLMSTNGCHYKVDTFVVGKYEMETPVITIEVFELSTTTRYQTYQWMLNGSIIQGATDSVYDVKENGMYQVIVGDGLCSDTSDVYKVTNYSSIETVNSIAGQTHIYPNPASHTIRVDAPITVDVFVYSLEGRLMKQVKAAREIDVRDMAEGVYFVHITDKNGTRIKAEKLVKVKGL